MSSGGVGYGSSEVINFERLPQVELSSGRNAQVKAIVRGGEIIEVIILNSGENYTSPPDLDINGSGVGSVLIPIIENGSLVSIKVVYGGSGYNDQTTIDVRSAGRGIDLKPILQTWTINLFEKNFSNITDDDGYISEGLNKNLGLQYSHMYAPRKLRESVFLG